MKKEEPIRDIIEAESGGCSVRSFMCANCEDRHWQIILRLGEGTVVLDLNEETAMRLGECVSTVSMKTMLGPEASEMVEALVDRTMGHARRSRQEGYAECTRCGETTDDTAIQIGDELVCKDCASDPVSGNGRTN